MNISEILGSGEIKIGEYRDTEKVLAVSSLCAENETAHGCVKKRKWTSGDWENKKTTTKMVRYSSQQSSPRNCFVNIK